MPLWNTVSISGYHIREAGSTAAQELAFTLADGIAYVQASIERGLDVDDFAPRLSFFFNSHNDFFEEIAKYRAGAPPLGAHDARALPRQGPALLDAALPHADGGLHADGPAAGEQHRARGPPGPGGRAGRHAVAAHQLHGRGAGAALGAGGAGGPAHAADHRPRERGDQYGGPAGRLLLRGGAHGQDRSRGRGLHRAHRSDGRHGGGHRARLPAG